MAPVNTSTPRERILAEGKTVLRSGGQCLLVMASNLGDRFVAAVETILACQGMVILTGIGKTGHVAQKISATLASTGTPSIYLHPGDALHGDLGRVSAKDVVLALSNSGASSEIIRLIQPIKSIGTPILAVTSDAESPLAREADVALCYDAPEEAGHLGLAPTTSTTLMLALGDALAMAALSQRNFSPAEFARFHPGGALGRSLLRVGDVMRCGEKNPRIREDAPLFEALKVMSGTPGRPGAVSVVDARGRLVGFYTDGDFRRQVEQLLADSGSALKRPIREFMTHGPTTTTPDRLVGEATRILRERKVDQLPVVDENGAPVGLLDVQDLLEVKVLG
jgi:arabinose-5-phosphate isomerase